MWKSFKCMVKIGALFCIHWIFQNFEWVSDRIVCLGRRTKLLAVAFHFANMVKRWDEGVLYGKSKYIVALHREGPPQPGGCPFTEEVMKHCRAEASCPTKPSCSTGERSPVSHSNRLPQRGLALTQPCWPEVPQESLVQVIIHSAATVADQVVTYPPPLLLPQGTSRVFRPPSHQGSCVPLGRVDNAWIPEGES